MGALPPVLDMMWKLLCSVINHYFRPVFYATRDDFLAASAKAAARLRKFARLAEEYKFPMHTFSVNLHICICQ